MIAPTGPVLRDIHPPSAGWWPPAPGWWILAVLILAGLGGLAWYLYRSRLPRRRWRAAREELAAIERAHAGHHDDAALAASVSQLLRRAARARDRTSVGLRGHAWHAALRDLAGTNEVPRVLLTLDETMYRPQVRVDAAALTAAARVWLRDALWREGQRA
jgi:hypothetical protein